MGLLLLLLLVLILIQKTGFVERSPEYKQEGYLDPAYTNQLRGLFAVLVIYSHLALNVGTDTGIIWSTYSTLGSYDVAIFFFLSGYGLLVQYQKKGRDYLKGFLWRRVAVSLVIPYIIFNVIYYVVYHLLGNPVSVTDMLYSWVNGHPLVSNSWYIIAIFYFYLVFFVAALICGRRLWLVTVLCFIGCLVWMVICHGMGYGDWWFYSCFPFAAGMLWLLIRKKAEKWFQKLFWVKEIVIFAACVVLYYAAGILPQYIGMQTPIYLGCMQLSAVLFSLCIICLGMRLRFEGRCLAVLGRCSLELYLIHGLFIMIFRGDALYVENNLVFSLAVLAASFAAAFLLHKLLGVIRRGLSGRHDCFGGRFQQRSDCSDCTPARPLDKG